jgi:osmotically inducible protein OsmC
MALSVGLEKDGATPESIRTSAVVHLDRQDEGFAVTTIELDTEVEAQGIDDAAFQDVAELTEKGCPVSKALAAVGTITLNARLV